MLNLLYRYRYPLRALALAATVLVAIVAWRAGHPEAVPVPDFSVADYQAQVAAEDAYRAQHAKPYATEALPLGTRLQREAGDLWEVTYDPDTRAFTVAPLPHEAACALELGIEWSVEEGATERLTDFTSCVRNRHTATRAPVR